MRRRLAGVAASASAAAFYHSTCCQPPSHAETSESHILPRGALPQRIPLHQQDAESAGDSHVSMVYLFKGRVDRVRLREALERTVTLQPALASRLMAGDHGLELNFATSRGCSFEARPMTRQVEDRLQDVLSAASFASDPVEVQRLLYHDLRIATVHPDLLDAPDEPLCRATLCEGESHTVIALSLA